MSPVLDLMAKPLGKILKEAGLINEGQLQVGLMEQNIYPHLKIGEIFVLHSWIKQETADFFAEEFRQIIKKETFKRQIGNFFNQAGLLSEKDIQSILREQKKTGIKFGSTAVLKGLIKKQTLDFYLKYFAVERSYQTDFQYKDSDILTQKKSSLQNQTNQANAAKLAVKSQKLTTSLYKYYDYAIKHFAKARSAGNKLQRLQYLNGFMKAYRKIEKLEMRNDPYMRKLPPNDHDKLDRMYVLVLAQLQQSKIETDFTNS